MGDMDPQKFFKLCRTDKEANAGVQEKYDGDRAGLRGIQQMISLIYRIQIAKQMSKQANKTETDTENRIVVAMGQGKDGQNR